MADREKWSVVSGQWSVVGNKWTVVSEWVAATAVSPDCGRQGRRFKVHVMLYWWGGQAESRFKDLGLGYNTRPAAEGRK